MEAYRYLTAEGLSEFLEAEGKLEMDNQKMYDSRLHISCLKLGGFIYDPWRLPMLGASIFAPDLLCSWLVAAVIDCEHIPSDECLRLLWFSEFGIKSHS